MILATITGMKNLYTILCKITPKTHPKTSFQTEEKNRNCRHASAVAILKLVRMYPLSKPSAKRFLHAN